MANAFDYSQTPSSNNSAAPDGAPEDMAPSAVNNTMRKMMANIAGAFDLYAATGTDTITATMDPAPTALTDRMFVYLLTAGANTGNVTFNPNALGAKKVLLEDGSEVPAGGMPGRAHLKYDSSADSGTGAWMLLNPRKGVMQVQETTSSAVATGSTQITLDDSIPQNTEGNEIVTVSITPKSAYSTLIIEAQAVVSHPTAAAMIGALFQDSTANALVAIEHSYAANQRVPVLLKHKMTSGTTSATTFKFRVGSSAAGTLTVNGFGGSRELGGTMNTFIRVTEIL